MNKYYSEMCLLEQPFFKDEAVTVEKLLQAKTGEIGEKVSVRRFVRFALGEGMEKKVNDLAAEVAEQLAA
jgi:elongation factor Ts